MLLALPARKKAYQMKSAVESMLAKVGILEFARRQSGNMSRALERVLAQTGILEAYRHKSWYVRRGFGRLDRTLVSTYLAAHDIRRLHIGCGHYLMPNWLNSDLFPSSSAVLHLDATADFPLPSASFDYVYSEHMIEHIPYFSGLNMLKECHRVLKSGGILRISTPNFQFLIDLYANAKTELQWSYINWSAETFIRSPYPVTDTLVINNFVRDWGHRFIYDEKTLGSSMETAGFKSITRCDLGLSNSAALSGLEHEERLPPRFLRLETLTLEGTK